MVNKSMKKLFVGLAVLSTAANLSAAAVQSTSKGFFQPRAASANIAREMLMQPNHHKESDGWCADFAATGFYQRGWNDNSVDTGATDSQVSGMGAFPFWSTTNSMTVGSNLAASSAAATDANVDAYQFGLGPVVVGATAATIELDPVIYQAGADFQFIVQSSAMEPGFLFKIKAPIAVYNINPNLSETDALTAVNYGQGSLEVSTTATYQPATTMTQAFSGTLGSTPAVAAGDYSPMQFGLINGQISSGAKFGDIELTAGYQFISNEDNSFSLAVRASAPTGNKATGVYMLEPIVGRGGNWGLGGYTAGHVNMWEGNNDNRLTFKFMAEAMHLFTTSTVRSYDLTDNGGGSRYLLVADYGTTGLVYQSAIQNLINYTTLASNSSFGVEGDVAVAFNYTGAGWSFDLGYEFYGRSAETLAITGDFVSGEYAILGRQGVGNSGAGGTATTLNQPDATIGSSEARVNAAPGGASSVVAVALATNVQLADLNVDGAEQAAYLTSKIFTKVGYEWNESDYVPFLGVMGEFEFSNCLNNALPQWSIALIGGVSF